MAVKKSKKIIMMIKEFNMDDWVSAKPFGKGGIRKQFDENQIKVTVKSHAKKKNYYYVTFGFRKKLFSALDKSLDSKIIVMKHKNDDLRFMLTPSDNGYKVNDSKRTDYFYIRSLIYSPTELNQENYFIDPIFHPKSPNNSGAIFELKIPQSIV